MSHIPASTEALQQFATDPSKGPDLEDLHFDMKGGMRSDWNQQALQLMRLDFKRQLEDSKDVDNIPLRSQQYIDDIFKKRFQRLVTVWKNGQCQMASDGLMESHEDVERRMIADKNVELKESRHTTRRISVCVINKFLIWTALICYI